MPVPSSIMAGYTSENIIARIIPGIINAISPRTMRMPVMMLAANKKSTFVKVKLKAVCKFACPLSSISEVNFTVIPVVKLLTIQLTIPDRNRTVTVAVKKAGKYANSCCDVGFTGATGITIADLTAMVTNPVRIPAARKGIKYCAKFREYKLNV